MFIHGDKGVEIFELPKGVKITCSNTTEDELKKFQTAIANLINQIEMNDYQDSLGHPIKNNQVYIELKELIKA